MVRGSKCLLCPDSSLPSYSRWLTHIIDPHHIQGRTRSDYTIPLCRYHHSLITDNKVDRQIIVDKANEFYKGKVRFFLPYEGSKKIKVEEI